MTYINGDHKKFRATFATHHGDKNAIPLPAAAFPDECKLQYSTDTQLITCHSKAQETRYTLL
jgi:hypothetical protein